MFGWFNNSKKIAQCKSEISTLHWELAQLKLKERHRLEAEEDKKRKDSIVTEVHSFSKHNDIINDIMGIPNFKFTKFKDGSIEINYNKRNGTYVFKIPAEDAKLLSMVIEENDN